jgi:AraC family transcriptional regulator
MNDLEPRIVTIPGKIVIGIRFRMSIGHDRTKELWQSFMVRRKEIKNNINSDLLCLQVYGESLDFKDFNPDTEFEKWAAVEVTDFNKIPEGMESLRMKGGLYAVFLYKGKASDFAGTFRYIFYSWLPKSEYELDTREHFDLLGDKYKNNDPDSEEEIWIPIRVKSEE